MATFQAERVYINLASVFDRFGGYSQVLNSNGDYVDSTVPPPIEYSIVNLRSSVVSASIANGNQVVLTPSTRTKGTVDVTVQLDFGSSIL